MASPIQIYARDLKEGRIPTPTTTPDSYFIIDDGSTAGGVVVGPVFVTTAGIPSAVAGYAKGCDLMDFTTGIWYRNTGTSTSCTFTAANSSTDYSGAAQTMLLKDNEAAALLIEEAANAYMTFVTTNSGEKIKFGVDLDMPAARSITILDNSATAFSIKEGANVYMRFITTDAGEKIQVGKTLDFTAAQSFTILDNTAAALNILEGANSYLKFDTTNSSELITTGVNLIAATSKTIDTTSADCLKSAGIIVPVVQTIAFRIMPHASQTTYTIFANKAVGWTVTGITVVPDLAQGGALTATLAKATVNATPASATTPLHIAGAIDCNATANNAQVIALTGTGADLILAATDKIGIVFSAALTTGILSGTITMKRT